jgi:hypothetical protein
LIDLATEPAASTKLSKVNGMWAADGGGSDGRRFCGTPKNLMKASDVLKVGLVNVLVICKSLNLVAFVLGRRPSWKGLSRPTRRRCL